MKSTKKRPSKAKPTRGSSTIKFTTLGLDRIKPTGKRQWFTEASDSKDRSGLKLCVEPTGAKRFVARIHVAGDVIDGKRMYVARDTTLGTYGDQPGQIDIAEAHRRLAKVRAEIAAGKSPVPFIVRAARPARRLKRRQRREPSPLFDRTPDGARPSPPDGEHSIEMLAYEFYWEFAVAERRRPEYVQRILERDVLRHFKGRDVRTITTRDVTLFLREIAERAPVMANRVQSLMFQMLRFGAEVGLLDSAPSTPSRCPHDAGGAMRHQDSGVHRGAARRDRPSTLVGCWIRPLGHPCIRVQDRTSTLVPDHRRSARRVRQAPQDQRRVDFRHALPGRQPVARRGHGRIRAPAHFQYAGAESV